MKKKKIISILKSSLLLALAVVILSSCKTNKQKDIRNLSKYINLKLEGANGSASTLVDFDKIQAKTQLLSVLKIEKTDDAERAKLDNLLESIKVEVLNDDKKIKNGDELKITTEVDKNLLKYFDLSLDEKQSVKVQGLKEAQEVDVFQGSKIKYEGYSPNLEIKIEKPDTDNEFFSSINYSIKNPPPYRKGQNVTLLARFDKELARKAGYKVLKNSKDILIPKDLGYYVENLPELTNTFIYDKYYEGYDLINKERENIGNFVTNNLGANSKLKEELSDPKLYIESDINISPEDGFFLVSRGNLRTKKNAEIGNKLVFIYKVDIENKTYNFPTFYVTYQLDGITKEANGTFTDIRGTLSGYDKYYDNILIGLANSVDSSYQTYKTDDLRMILETEELKGTNTDKSEEYKYEGK